MHPLRPHERARAHGAGGQAGKRRGGLRELGEAADGAAAEDEREGDAVSDTGLIEAASGQCKTMADGTLRITFDVEPRHAAAAFALFSAPGTPAVLGRLVAAHEAPKPAKPEAAPMGPLCKWAVMRCAEPEFQLWARRQYDRAMGGSGMGWGDVTPEEDFAGNLTNYTAHCVKVLAGVSSRRDLDEPEIAERFKAQIMKPYGAWLSERAHA